MSLPFQKDEEEIVLPDKAKAALENHPRIQPEASFNRMVIQSLDLEKMRRRATLVGRIEEFLGIGLWQFASTSALGAFIPVVILGSMLISAQQPSDQDALPNPIPDPLNLDFYQPIYARELFEYPVKSPQKPLITPTRTGELCPISKSPLV
jgi:hypothetical protein